MSLPPPTKIADLDLLWITTAFDRVAWRFASSMPSVPHYYSMKIEWGEPPAFKKAARLIADHGTPEKLWNFRVRRYLYVGDWRYWTMTGPETTSTINRCDPNHPRYKGQIKKAVER